MSENQVVIHRKDKIYFKGELINQLIQSRFQVYMNYDFEIGNIRKDSCDKSAWFQIYNMFIFADELESGQLKPTMLISDTRRHVKIE